jgi:hypothetical protein
MAVGQQHTLFGRSESGNKLLVALNHKYSWHELLQMVKRLVGWKRSGRGQDTYILVLGMLDVRAPPAPSSAIMVTLQEWQY